MAKPRIKFQDPPSLDKPVPDTLTAVTKRPNEWALAATVGPDEVPEWWNEMLLNPDFRYRIVPQDATDPTSQRDFYVMFQTESIQHYLEPHQHDLHPQKTKVQTHPDLDTTEA